MAQRRNHVSGGGGGSGGAPSGAAGGVLGGTYPNPSFASPVAANLVIGAGQFISVGTNPAATGDLRLANNTNGVQFRNAANSADVGGMYVTSANTLVVAGTGSLIVQGNTGIFLTTLGGAAIRNAGPIIADSSAASNPYGCHGRVSVAMSDADNTPTASQYANTIMEFTGTLTAGRNVIFPTVDGYYKIVYNNTTGGFALTFKTSAGTGVSVAAGKRAIVYCDNTNIVRASPDA